MVRVARLELAASCSQSRRATNCATPGWNKKWKRCALNSFYSIVYFWKDCKYSFPVIKYFFRLTNWGDILMRMRKKPNLAPRMERCANILITDPAQNRGSWRTLKPDASALWLCHPWTSHQASLSFTTPQSLLKLMSIESVMPSNHLILCHPLLLPPSIFPSIRIFSNESALRIRWPKSWSFSFNISPSSE